MLDSHFDLHYFYSSITKNIRHLFKLIYTLYLTVPYSICTQPDMSLFKAQCAAIEKSVLGLKKDNLVMEADGSAYQSYKHERGVIDVSNDCYIGALYVDADFDLRPYFQHIV